MTMLMRAPINIGPVYSTAIVAGLYPADAIARSWSECADCKQVTRDERTEKASQRRHDQVIDRFVVPLEVATELSHVYNNNRRTFISFCCFEIC